MRRRAREGGICGEIGGEREKEEPPGPEAFDGAPPTTGAADKRVLLCVGVGNHLANEYARTLPNCHRTLRLFATGNGG
jgi:hypothetical protein